MSETNPSAQHFLGLLKKSRRGKFKIYIDISAGVGKTFRMLQEAYDLLRNGVDVKIGYIETHNRKETHELLEGLPVIPQLRELAMREVASHVERKAQTEIPKLVASRREKFLACISSNENTARHVIRKTARLASYYNSRWLVLYVQTPHESQDKIALDKQRHLINNFKLATEMGAEIVRVKNANISEAIIQVAETTICAGKPHITPTKVILATNLFNNLLKKLSSSDIDPVILY